MEVMTTNNKRLKRIWYAMVRRCHGEKIPQRVALYYRDKGITVCDEWRNDFSEFEKWAIENGYNDEMTIDRVDSDKNYCPENCQWITKSENSKKASEYWRNNKNNHRSEVGHFMVIERVQKKSCGYKFTMYKVIQTGLYKSEARSIAKMLNSENPPYDQRFSARVTKDCKVGDVVFWEQTGQYLKQSK